MGSRVNRTVKKRIRTVDWARGETASLLDVKGLGPNKLKALVASEIVTIRDFLNASDEKLWSIVGPLQGRPVDPQRAAEVLDDLRRSARDAASNLSCGTAQD